MRVEQGPPAPEESTAITELAEAAWKCVYLAQGLSTKGEKLAK
jgi:hypothetical protein